MSFTHSSIKSDNVTVEVPAVLSEKPGHLSDERWQTVLDDPSFRRLLRDGHQADTTTALLAQLEDNE